MKLEKIKLTCESFPHVTQDIKWDNDLVYSIGGKMFAIINLSKDNPNNICIKVEPERFLELTDQSHIIPAPYLARYHWVTITDTEQMKAADLGTLIEQSYQLIVCKLPKKVQKSLI